MIALASLMSNSAASRSDNPCFPVIQIPFSFLRLSKSDVVSPSLPLSLTKEHLRYHKRLLLELLRMKSQELKIP